MYNIVYWDICGACNAKCRFCPSGSRHIGGDEHKKQAGILSPGRFEDALRYLSEIKAISPRTTHLALYNWGEPFLHPEFATMLRVAANGGYVYSLSTNASVLKTIPADTLWRLSELKFSFPGFSQESYDKMHGFNFNDIMHNVKSMIHWVREFNSKVSFVMSYHVYRHNISEIRAAQEFCYKQQIGFWPIYATLQGVEIPNAEEKEQLSDCLIEVWDQIKAEQPEFWQCPQFNILAIDEYCNVVQCCVAERFTQGYVLGNIREVNFNDLDENRRKHPACIDCIRTRNAYLQHNINYRG